MDNWPKTGVKSGSLVTGLGRRILFASGPKFPSKIAEARVLKVGGSVAA